MSTLMADIVRTTLEQLKTEDRMPIDLQPDLRNGHPHSQRVVHGSVGH